MTDFDPHWYADPKLHSDDYFLLFRLGSPEQVAAAAETTVDRLVEYLGLEPKAKVLDLACGWGRIALPLAERGFEVTGIDLSEDFIARARSSADEKGLNIRFSRSDMRNVPFEAEFNAAIMMWSSFGQLESDEEHQKVLGEIARVLKPGGKLLLDLRNREWIFKNYRDLDWEEREGGVLLLTDRQLRLDESRNYVRCTVIERDGTRRTYSHTYRFYTLAELVNMVAAAGLTFDRAFGDWDGGDYRLDSRLMIVRASKAA